MSSELCRCINIRNLIVVKKNSRGFKLPHPVLQVQKLTNIFKTLERIMQLGF